MSKHPKAHRSAGEAGGNPFTLIPKLYRAGKVDELLDVLTGVYWYLRRRTLPRALRAAWKREVNSGMFHHYPSLDFLVQQFGRRNPRGYFIRVHVYPRGVGECYLDYDNGNLAMTADGHKSPVARRARQLLGDV